MLTLIKGKQRSGKSYYCCTLIMEYLQNTKRPIFTNLPLNPDILCDVACGGKLRHPAIYESYLKRIYMFKRYDTRRKRREFSEYKKKNPVYHSFRKSNNLIINDKYVMTFWQITKPNSIILIDELYQYFPASSSADRDPGVVKLRNELLTYTRQHGHMKDDMFLISHHEKDIDVNIRRGVQRVYVVENSKYKNVSDKWLFKGFKWPIQMFIITVYDSEDLKHHTDRYFRISKAIIFKCYDSYSPPESLNKEVAAEDAESTDTHIDHKKNIFNYLASSWVFFAMIFFGVYFLYAAYSYAQENLFKSTSSPVNASSLSISKGQGQGSAQEQAINIPVYLKAVYVSSSSVIFEDGFKLIKGDMINGFTVKKFMRDYIVIHDGLRELNVSYNGIRHSSKPESIKK